MESVVGRGTLLAGRYRTVQPLASDLPGASSWEASDQILDRPVRVTVLHAGRVPQALDAARRAALVTDPRLVRILDVGEHEGVAYAVTEQVAGPSLAELVARGPLPADQVRAVVGEAASALEAARRRGVHHLALRPSVLHLTPDDRVLITGLAVDGALLGLATPDADAASRADTVALVGLLYAALTGRWPGTVPGTDSRVPHLAPAPVLEGAPVPPAELTSGVPNDLDTLCAVTLGVHDDGPRTPAELVQELEPWGDIRAADLFDGTQLLPVPTMSSPAPRVPAPDVPTTPTRVQRTSVRSVLAGGSSAMPSRPGTPPPAVPTRSSSITGPAVRARAASPDAPTVALPSAAAAAAAAPSAPSPGPTAVPTPTRTPTPTPDDARRAPAAGVGAPAPERRRPPAVSSAEATTETTSIPEGSRRETPTVAAPVPGASTGAPTAAAAARPASGPAARPSTARTTAPAAGAPRAPATPSRAAGTAPRSADPASAGRTPATAPPTPPRTPAAPRSSGAPVRTAASAPSPPASREPARAGGDRSPLAGLGARPGGIDVAAARESIAAHRFDPTRLVLLLVSVAIVVGLFTAYRALTRPVDLGAGTPAPAATQGESAEQPAEEPPPAPAEEPAPDGQAPAAPVIASGAQLDPPPDGDQNEHPEAVPLAIDGDPSTVWFTRTYNRPDFAGLKEGVGYAVTLAEPSTVSTVTLRVQGSGGRVEVRATDPATPTEGPVLAEGSLGPDTVLTLSEPVETEHIVLWFTELPRTADGANRIELAEVSVS